MASIWYVCFHPLASFMCLFLLVSMINPYYIFFSSFICFGLTVLKLEPLTYSRPLVNVFTGGLKMLLVSSDFATLFRIPEKRAQFFRVNSQESGLQHSPEELIHRLVEMFETGAVSMGRKFPEWELHPQNQGVHSLLSGGEGGRKSQVHEGRVGCSCPGLCPWAMGFCTLEMPEGPWCLPVPVLQKKNAEGSSNTMCCFLWF